MFTPFLHSCTFCDTFVLAVFGTMRAATIHGTPAPTTKTTARSLLLVLLILGSLSLGESLSSDRTFEIGAHPSPNMLTSHKSQKRVTVHGIRQSAPAIVRPRMSSLARAIFLFCVPSRLASAT
jgi:hypothetical protein